MAEWFTPAEDPLHTMTFPPEYTYEELDAAMNGLRTFYHTYVLEHPRRAIGLLVDLSRVRTSSARNRSRISRCMDQLRPTVAETCAGQAYVVKSPLVQAALSAILFLKKTPWPTKVTTAEPVARQWLLAQISTRQSALDLAVSASVL